MESIKFKSKIWKTGTSFVVTIPKDFVKNKIIEEDKDYLIEVGDYFGEGVA